MVVDYEGASKFDADENTQILVQRLLAHESDRLRMITEESVLNKVTRRVDAVDDGVGVPVVPCCEDGDFVVDVCSPK